MSDPALFEKIKHKIKPKAIGQCPNAPGDLAIYVTRSDNHKPVPGAQVNASGPSPGAGKTDAEGWIILADRTPGAYQTDVKLPASLAKFRLASATQAGAVACADTEILHFQASPPPVLKIKLIGRRPKDGTFADEALAGVELEVAGPAQYSPSTTHDWATVGELEPGNYRIKVKSLGPHAQQYAIPSAVDVSLALGETKQALLVATPKLVWAKLKFLDDLNGTGVAAVKTNVTLPNGHTQEFASLGGNEIEIKDILPGRISAACSLKGAKLPSTLHVAGVGDKPGGKQDADDEPIPNGSYIAATIAAHKVRKGDALDSIAAKAGLTGDDLAVFNFGTADKAAVNEAIRARVGSKTLGADKVTFLFDDADKPGLVYVPKEWKLGGLATEQTHSVRLRPVVPRWLAILKLDDHFAPGAEKLDITYSIGGSSKKKVFLEINSDHYGNNPIYKRELTPPEVQDGKHTIQWDGKTTCAAGELKDQHVSPLFAPYKVHIYVDATYTDEAEFTVLYHSIEIRKGPWTADEKEPAESDEKAWVRYKLNELGYWGGPVDQDFTDSGDPESYLTKAIIRYKASHKKLHELSYAKYNATITADLKAALKAKENPRSGFLDEAAFKNTAAESKVLVEAVTYEDGEFGTPKPPYEKKRVNRPLIPVEVDIFLKSKVDAKTSAPAGVGACRVNWRHADSDEDLAPQVPDTATEPSKTKKYVEDCMKLKSGRTGTGDNAHKDFGGIRDDAKDWVTPWPIGKKYTPHETVEDAGQKVVYSKACIDATKYPKRVGKAGAFFQPSRVSGDDYKIRAEIDFTGLPNQAVLEKLHGVVDAPSRIHVETGKFRIWRFNKIALVVNWPARTSSEDWPLIKAEFAKAWLDIDTAHIAYKKMSDVISSGEYRTIVKANTKHKTYVPFFSPMSLEDDALVGVALPAQGSLAAAAYKAALKTFTNDDFWNKIYGPLRAQISKNMRKTYPDGFIVVNFLTHKPVAILKAPPGDTTVVDPSFITWTFSIGLEDSVIFADQKDPDKVYYVVAHEMGHNFWLQHWENAGPVMADHDNNDHNCSMAYSGSLFPHQAPGVYTPHFCGKCNLKLRGWDVNAAGIPASS